MNAAELFDVARSCADHVSTQFGQVIAITFAMVVAIYYFLNRARLVLKLFAFVIYMIGMLMYLGLMLTESTVERGALAALEALPQNGLPLPILYYLAVAKSWLGVATSLMINGGYHLLWIGVAWLLFGWRKPEHPHEAH